MAPEEGREVRKEGAWTTPGRVGNGGSGGGEQVKGEGEEEGGRGGRTCHVVKDLDVPNLLPRHRHVLQELEDGVWDVLQGA
jgi:hypothetical protein